MKKLLKLKDRIRYNLYSMPFMQSHQPKNTTHKIGLTRLLRLKKDLSGIDFKRDVLEHLQNLENNA